jgi:hypothetical protein
MRLIGCDLHAAKQTIAMLDGDTGEIVEKTLTHEGETVRAFYASIPKPVVVGIEATARWDGSGADGGIGHHVPCRSSGHDSKGRNASAKT